MIDLEKWSIWFCAAIVALFIFSGCSPTSAYVAARKTEAVMSTTVMDAYTAWRIADHAKQESILASSTSWADYQTKIAAWRKEQAQVDKQFETARDAVYAFSQSLDASGAALQKNFSGTIANLIGVVQTLGQLLLRYGIKIPGVTL